MSIINFEDFLREFATELDIQALEDLDKPLKEISQYDSMGKITTSLLIERLFAFEISFQILESEKTLQSLYDFCASTARKKNNA